MPVSTSTRSSTAYATPAFPLTPSQASLNPMSPPSTSSHSPTVTSVGQVVKANVVTRIAIEGKAKQGEEGASVKMYLKVSYSKTVNSKPSKYDNFDSLLFPWTPSHQDQPLRFSQVRDISLVAGSYHLFIYCNRGERQDSDVSSPPTR